MKISLSLPPNPFNLQNRKIQVQLQLDETPETIEMQSEVLQSSIPPPPT